MKKIKISSLLLLASLSWGVAANITLTTSGDFSTLGNWSLDGTTPGTYIPATTLPGSSDTAFLTGKNLDVKTSVNVGSILTSVAGGSVGSTINVNNPQSNFNVGSNLYIGHGGTSSDVYNQSGGKTSVGNEIVLNNSPRLSGASSTLNLSGGTLTATTIGTGYYDAINKKGNDNTTAIINVSGGSLTVNNSILLGNNANISGGTATLNISGSANIAMASLQAGVTKASNATSSTVKISGNSAIIKIASTTLGSGFIDNSNLIFELASSDVSYIDATGMTGIFQLGAGMNSIVIDGTYFTGALGSKFDLIRATQLQIGGGLLNSNKIRFINFAAGTSGQLSQEGNILKFTLVAVPEPSTYFMMGAGLLLVGFASFRRRMSVA